MASLANEACFNYKYTVCMLCLPLPLYKHRKLKKQQNQARGGFKERATDLDLRKTNKMYNWGTKHEVGQMK